MWYRYNGGPRVQDHWLWASQTDQVQSLPLTKSKGREMSGGEIKEFISGTPTPGRQ